MNQLEFENGYRRRLNTTNSRGQASNRSGRTGQSQRSASRNGTGRSNSSLSYSSSPRRGGSHHRKNKPDFGRIAFIGVALILLIACGIVLAKGKQKAVSAENSTEESTVEAEIKKEIAVEDVSITGMSRAEAKAAIQKKYPWAMKVVYGEDSYQVTDLIGQKVEDLLNKIYAASDPKEKYSIDTSGLEEAASAEAANAAAKWDRKAVNGSIDSFDKEKNTFVFAGEQTGFAISQEKLAEDILEAISQKKFDATIAATGAEVQPEITQATAKEKYKTISSFTTNTTANSNRNTNVKLAAEAINGSIIKPGQEFSFNDAVGQRTEAKGYKAAGAYNNGEVVQEIGGGVCQVSTTLFNAVYRAGLEVSHRRSHTFEPTYIKPGQDATVSWEQPDFKFINNSSTAIGIKASYADQKVTVAIYGIPILEEGEKWDLSSEKVETLDPPAPVYEEDQTLEIGVEKVKSQGTQGSRWTTYKVVTKNGEEVSREVDHKTTYKGHAPVILRNTSGVVLRPEETTTGEATIVSTVDGMPEDYIPESGSINGPGGQTANTAPPSPRPLETDPTNGPGGSNSNSAGGAESGGPTEQTAAPIVPVPEG